MDETPLTPEEKKEADDLKDLAIEFSDALELHIPESTNMAVVCLGLGMLTVNAHLHADISKLDFLMAMAELFDHASRVHARNRAQRN